MLSDVSMKMGMLSIQGPKSREILQQQTQADLSNDAFPFNTCQYIEVAGHRVLALRVSFVGEMGWELHIPAEYCIDIHRALMKSGNNFVPFGKSNDIFFKIVFL